MKRLLTALLLALPVLAEWRQHYGLGDALLTQGKLEEAQRELAAALQEAEAAHQEGPSLGVILDALGRAELQAGRYRPALKYFERSLGIWAPQSEARAHALCNAAQAYQSIGEWSRAEDSVRRALEILPQSPQIWLVLGQVLYLKHDYVGAETAQRKALVIWEESKSPEAATALNDLAVLYQARRKNQQAVEALERAVAIMAAGQARARVLTNLGVLSWKLGRRSEGDAHLSRALKEMETAVGPHHPDTGKVLNEYSAVLWKTGRKIEASEMEKRAHEIRSAFASQTNSGQGSVDWHDLK